MIASRNHRRSRPDLPERVRVAVGVHRPPPVRPDVLKQHPEQPIERTEARRSEGSVATRRVDGGSNRRGQDCRRRRSAILFSIRCDITSCWRKWRGGFRVFIDHYDRHRPHRILALTPPRPKRPAVLSEWSSAFTPSRRDQICAPYRLRRRRQGDSRVFHRDGVPVRQWRTALRDACRKAKVPHRLLHDCRRTAARNVIRAGVPDRYRHAP